jgi:hypothetical protein
MRWTEWTHESVNRRPSQQYMHFYVISLLIHCLLTLSSFLFEIIVPRFIFKKNEAI